MPYIESAILNPINVVDKNRVLPANYNWHHFDGWLSTEQITQFETYKCDAQKWQLDDICFLQMRSDFSPVRLQVRNSKGRVVLSQVMDIVKVIGTKIYLQAQIAFDDPVFSEGYYLLEFLAGDPVLITLEATLFHLKEKWPGTMLVKYGSLFNNEILWETRTYMTFRVDGVIPFQSTDSIATVYIDQPGSATNVKGDAFRLFKLIIGCDGGVPNWVPDKMEEIIIQNIAEFDGKGFAKVPQAKWSTKKIDRYPLAQWNIDMRESVNRRFKRFEATGIQEKKVAMDYIVEGKLFGPLKGAANDNTYTINTIS